MRNVNLLWHALLRCLVASYNSGRAQKESPAEAELDAHRLKRRHHPTVRRMFASPWFSGPRYAKAARFCSSVRQAKKPTIWRGCAFTGSGSGSGVGSNQPRTVWARWARACVIGCPSRNMQAHPWGFQVRNRTCLDTGRQVWHLRVQRGCDAFRSPVRTTQRPPERLTRVGQPAGNRALGLPQGTSQSQRGCPA